MKEGEGGYHEEEGQETEQVEREKWNLDVQAMTCPGVKDVEEQARKE